MYVHSNGYAKIIEQSAQKNLVGSGPLVWLFDTDKMSLFQYKFQQFHY